MFHPPYSPGHRCNPLASSGPPLASCGPAPGPIVGFKADPRQPPEPGQVELLAAELSRLDAAVSGLEQGLAGVLRMTGPDAACGLSAGGSLDSPLAIQVRRVGGIIARVHEIADRVQA